MAATALACADTVLPDLRGHKFATEESLEDEKEKKTEAKAETKESASKAYVSFRDLRKTSLYAIFKSNEEEQEHQFNFLHRSWNMDYLKVNFFVLVHLGSHVSRRLMRLQWSLKTSSSPHMSNRQSLKSNLVERQTADIWGQLTGKAAFPTFKKHNYRDLIYYDRCPTIITRFMVLMASIIASCLASCQAQL